MIEREAVGVHLGGDQAVERLDRGGRGALALVVAEHEDADVARVVVLDVGALELGGAAGPDPASGVDRVVVADVGPALVDVAPLDRVEAAGGVVVERAAEGAHPVVVDGEAADLAHAVRTRQDRALA